MHALHRAGVPLIADTDANQQEGAPAAVAHGSALHSELALLVQAGLTPTEALQSATSVVAARLGLPDRGVIRTGARADVVLIEGDPTQDIHATQAIRGVWIGGQPVRQH